MGSYNKSNSIALERQLDRIIDSIQYYNVITMCLYVICICNITMYLYYMHMWEIIRRIYDTYRHTEIQTFRHTAIQTYRHTDIQTYRHTDYRHTDIQT